MRVIPRSETGLAAPKRAIANIGPKGLVFRHHSVTRPESHGSTAEHWRYIQQIAFNRGFWDLSYSFGIFPNGDICEGRGWGKLGAHTSGYNDDSWGIVFVGNYDQIEPTPAQIMAYRWLIFQGKETGWITGGPTHKEHDEVSATACPGNNIEAKRAELDKPWNGLPNIGGDMTWEALGGELLSAPSAAVRLKTGSIHVVVRGTDSHVWHKFWDGTRWQGWEDLGGMTEEAPAITSREDGQLDVFVKGTDGQLWHRWYNGQRWS